MKAKTILTCIAIIATGGFSAFAQNTLESAVHSEFAEKTSVAEITGEGDEVSDSTRDNSTNEFSAKEKKAARVAVVATVGAVTVGGALYMTFRYLGRCALNAANRGLENWVDNFN